MRPFKPASNDVRFHFLISEGAQSTSPPAPLACLSTVPRENDGNGDGVTLSPSSLLRLGWL